MTSAKVVPLHGQRLRDGECLYCWLARSLETAGCDHTLSLTNLWIAAQPRSARWVVKWAQQQGGYCDCEVLMTTFRDDKGSTRHRKVRCAASYANAGTERCRGAEG